MIGGVLCLISAVGVITTSFVGGILFLIFCAWPLYVAFCWYKWFKEDTLENTERVVCTMKCQLVVVLVLVALLCVMVIIDIGEVGLGGLVSAAINGGINVLITYYFFYVTKRYKLLKHEQ